jgi:DNA-binding MurR/RpiR family transcriptional regulator
LADRSVLDLIYRKKGYLNPALRRIGEFTLGHPDLCKTMTISELAIACDVAESTVSRFVREIGLKSYQDLKIALTEAVYANDADARQQDSTQKSFYENVNRDDSTETIIEKVAFRNLQTLKGAKQQLDIEEIDRAVDIINGAGTLLFSCMGSSAVAAEEAVMRFTRAGKKCLLYRDESIQLMTAAVVGGDDALLGVSNSGRSAPVVNALKLAKSRGVPTIAITSFEDSPVAKLSDIAIFTPTKTPPPGLDLYGEATTSVSAQLFVIDVLYTSFAARNFDETLRYLEMTYATAIKDTRVGDE